MTPDPSARKAPSRANLAHQLGRTHYPPIAEVRRLTALGLREAPNPETPKPQNPDSVRAPQASMAPPPPAPLNRPARLPRRKPGAHLPKNVAEDPPPYTPADEALLDRVSTALRAIRTR